MYAMVIIAYYLIVWTSSSPHTSRGINWSVVSTCISAVTHSLSWKWLINTSLCDVCSKAWGSHCGDQTKMRWLELNTNMNQGQIQGFWRKGAGQCACKSMCAKSFDHTHKFVNHTLYQCECIANCLVSSILYYCQLLLTVHLNLVQLGQQNLYLYGQF